jgi:segregation and condensation protein B
LVEAALFISSSPISLQTISKICKTDEEIIKRILEELKKEYEKEDHGIELVETPQGYEIRVKPIYRNFVKNLAPFSDLSEGLLRALSIILIKQPITQAEVVKYQGNKAYGYIKELEKRGLIKTKPHKNTKIIFVTPELEKYFGMSLDEIKRVLEEKNG